MIRFVPEPTACKPKSQFSSRSRVTTSATALVALALVSSGCGQQNPSTTTIESKSQAPTIATAPTPTALRAGHHKHRHHHRGLVAASPPKPAGPLDAACQYLEQQPAIESAVASPDSHSVTVVLKPASERPSGESVIDQVETYADDPKAGIPADVQQIVIRRSRLDSKIIHKDANPAGLPASAGSVETTLTRSSTGDWSSPLPEDDTAAP